MEKLWKKLINKETILYLVFGILTTAINIAVCGLLSDILKWDIYLSNTIAWILSVIFAFVKFLYLTANLQIKKYY